MVDSNLEGPTPYPQSSGPAEEGNGLIVLGGYYVVVTLLSSTINSGTRLTDSNSNWTVTSWVVCFWKTLKKSMRGDSLYH